MNEREQIINFLLQQCDAKNATITGLQATVADLQKRLDSYVNVTTPINGHATQAQTEAQ